MFVGLQTNNSRALMFSGGVSGEKAGSVKTDGGEGNTSVSLAFPPVGWHSTVLQLPHSTTVCAWLKTVVMLKQPGCRAHSQHTRQLSGEQACEPAALTQLPCTCGADLRGIFQRAGAGRTVTRALHIHEVAVRALNKPLELMLLLLQGGVGVKKVILELRGGRKVRPGPAFGWLRTPFVADQRQHSSHHTSRHITRTQRR